MTGWTFELIEDIGWKRKFLNIFSSSDHGPITTYYKENNSENDAILYIEQRGAGLLIIAATDPSVYPDWKEQFKSRHSNIYKQRIRNNPGYEGVRPSDNSNPAWIIDRDDKQLLMVSHGKGGDWFEECIKFINQIEKVDPLPPEIEERMWSISNCERPQLKPPIENPQTINDEWKITGTKFPPLVCENSNPDSIIDYLIYHNRDSFELITNSREKAQKLVTAREGIVPDRLRWHDTVNYGYGIVIEFGKIMDRKSLDDTMEFIDQFAPIPREIKENIRRRSGYLHVVSPRDMCDDVLTLARQNKFREAFEKAIEATHEDLGHKDVLWVLAEYYREIWDVGHAVDAYQEIPENNLHYSEANERVLMIIGNYLDIVKNNGSLTKKEIQEYQEIQFRCSLKSGPQRFIDQLYGELCNIPFTGEPKFKDVGADSDTLINVAGFIKNQNKTLTELLSKNEKLQKENDEFKNNTTKTNMPLGKYSSP